MLTPNLWSKNSIYNIEQFELKNSDFKFQSIDTNLRLGMFVEQVIFQAIEKDIQFEIITKNLQIIKDGVTLGELDCILKNESQLIHLEIVYKFYLLDPTISDNQIECWIGPNKKDSFKEKLNKLRDKQFPLLHKDKTKEVLCQLQLATEEVNQKVCFKAQLYLPFNFPVDDIKTLNKDCVAGFYYHFDQLDILKDCKFYIPSKIEWLSLLSSNLSWINFDTYKLKIKTLLKEKRSPLCFVKDKKGNLSKIFVVWW